MKIIFEFLGGPRDGTRLIGDTEYGLGHAPDESEAALANGFYAATNAGTVGAEFDGLSDYPPEVLRTIGEEAIVRDYELGTHMYEVFDRSEEGNEILVRVRYEG